VGTQGLLASTPNVCNPGLAAPPKLELIIFFPIILSMPFTF